MKLMLSFFFGFMSMFFGFAHAAATAVDVSGFTGDMAIILGGVATAILAVGLIAGQIRGTSIAVGAVLRRLGWIK